MDNPTVPLQKFKSVASRYKQSNIALKNAREQDEKKNNWMLKTLSPKKVWDYIEIFQPRYQIDNYTVIGEYTNKKGRTSDVHYNINGKYMGSISKYGPTPILVQSWSVPFKATHVIRKTESGCVIFHKDKVPERSPEEVLKMMAKKAKKLKLKIKK